MLSQTSVAPASHTPPSRFSAAQIKLLRQAFPGLDEASLNDLAHITQERILPAGTFLCREGQAENAFYLISVGRVMVSQQLEQDTSRILAYRGAGEFVGELSLLIDDQPRTADVVTVQETSVLEIDREKFLHLLHRSPSVVLAVLRVLADRQSESDHQTIADLRQKYNELAETYRRLKEETNRRSEFLTTVAHELRTPLTVIKGYLALLRMGAFSGEALQEAIRTVHLNLDTIIGLVNNVLLLQQIALISPRFQAVSIGDVIEQLLSNLRGPASLPDNLTIRAEVPADLPLIQGGPAELGHALGAILNNAIKFTPEGGEIVIRAYAENGTLSVQVSDPGVGIAPDVLPCIFDHFHYSGPNRTHLSGGLGLGLPLAKAVIEQHHGDIYVESELGKGSTVTIRLPVKGLAGAQDGKRPRL